MRSLVLAVAFAAPLSAVAATPNPGTYTSPMSRQHAAKDEMVYLTFISQTPQDREVQIGNEVYRVRYNAETHVLVPVGSVVREYSQSNSRVNGVELMQVSASDTDRTVTLK